MNCIESKERGKFGKVNSELIRETREGLSIVRKDKKVKKRERTKKDIEVQKLGRRRYS